MRPGQLAIELIRSGERDWRHALSVEALEIARRAGDRLGLANVLISRTPKLGYCVVESCGSGELSYAARAMPELSRFYGIIIRMFVEVGTPHHRPHFHAYYQNEVGIFSLQPAELIAGELPRRQRRLVEAWAELHEAELLADWQLLQAGQQPLPIAPLS